MGRTHSLEPPPNAGHLIRAFRLQLGLTLEELAHALGISFSTVSRWENGHMKPSGLAWEALGKLAAENGTPLLRGVERRCHDGREPVDRPSRGSPERHRVQRLREPVCGVHHAESDAGQVGS